VGVAEPEPDPPTGGDEQSCEASTKKTASINSHYSHRSFITVSTWLRVEAGLGRGRERLRTEAGHNIVDEAFAVTVVNPNAFAHRILNVDANEKIRPFLLL
jgi:hypothetical protein